MIVESAIQTQILLFGELIRDLQNICRERKGKALVGLDHTYAFLDQQLIK